MALRLVGEGNSVLEIASGRQSRRYAWFFLLVVLSAGTASSAREKLRTVRPERVHLGFNSGLAISANLPVGTVGPVARDS